jgi:hypothetical protein
MTECFLHFSVNLLKCRFISFTVTTLEENAWRKQMMMKFKRNITCTGITNYDYKLQYTDSIGVSCVASTPQEICKTLFSSNFGPANNKPSVQFNKRSQADTFHIKDYG